jgi:ubiquinone/menaquinone biosynthesis C-methylase UbiE
MAATDLLSDSPVLDYGIVDLAAQPEAEPVRRVREHYLATNSRLRYTPNDWARLSLALARLPGGRAHLDVGVSHGQFLNAVAVSGRYERIVGVDIVSRNPIVMSDRIELREMSVTELAFADREFESVTCMEVLEHLDGAMLQRALAELRRVCRGRLLITVPFKEPLPLSKYHRQRFDEAVIARHFPAAACTLLVKSPAQKVPWMLIEEDRRSRLRRLFSRGLPRAARPADDQTLQRRDWEQEARIRSAAQRLISADAGRTVRRLIADARSLAMLRYLLSDRLPACEWIELGEALPSNGQATANFRAGDAVFLHRARMKLLYGFEGEDAPVSWLRSAPAGWEPIWRSGPPPSPKRRIPPGEQLLLVSAGKGGVGA